jgi:hypothetical protein
MNFTLSRLIGMEEEEARLLTEYYNHKFVVIEEDGQFFFVTSSWDEDRVLVRIKGGKVTEAKAG